MSEIKLFLKRFLLSTNAILWITVYYAFRRRKFDVLFGNKFNRVHIICPGPSANNLFQRKEPIKDEDAVILVNHALKLYPKLKGYSKNVFFFSSDGTRVDEAIKMYEEDFKSVFSVLCVEHLFHLRKSTIQTVNLVTLPKLKYSREFGWVGLNNGPESFNSLKYRPIASGFGSMIYSLQLAVRFNPEIIKLWGCDFGEKNGVRYYNSSLPVRKVESFNKTLQHFLIVKEIIESKGIRLQS